MKKIVYLLFTAFALFAGCKNDQYAESPLEEFTGGFEVELESVVCDTELDTKTFADEDHLVLWHNDDRVSVFEKKEYWEEYKYTGRTGTVGGRLIPLTSAGSGTGGDLDYYYAVYPHSELNGFNNKGHLLLTLPNEQPYDEFSFGRGTNLMVSASEDNNFKFKNIGGYLVFKLYGEGVSVSSIRLTGNNGEEISGDIDVVISPGVEPTVTMSTARYAEKYDYVELVCDPPVALGATASDYKEFWFVLPPMTFTGGFSIEVTTSDGGVWTKTTVKSWTITRNHYSPVSTMEVEPVHIPDIVDMGLSVKWASSNLGAFAPEEFGDYYAWGLTMPGLYEWPVYQWCNGDYNLLTKYCNDPSYGYNGFTDTRTVLEPEDDAAQANLGGKWRMPTLDEWIELRENCTWTWTTQNGVSGVLVTANNGNCIFLPAAGLRIENNLSGAGYGGYYWSSSLGTGGRPDHALDIEFNSSHVSRLFSLRYWGLSLRPVYGESGTIIPVESVSLDKTEQVLFAGNSSVFVATVLPTNASYKRVSWSSSNTSVATVSSSGVVTAVSAGSAIITATTIDGGKTATCNITVVTGLEAVDLGLSSGLKWASINLGAESPEEYGDYYAWGETETHYSSLNPSAWKDSGYNWENYAYTYGATSGSNPSKYNSTDSKTVLDPEDDAATANWGDAWRMPTDADWTELRNNCTWKWFSLNEVEGFLVTGSNGNSIFLPFAGRYISNTGDGVSYHGYYWSSSLYSSYPDDAWIVSFDYSNQISSINRSHLARDFGCSVRPVCP